MRNTAETVSNRNSFVADVSAVASRAIRSLTREPEFIGPALAIPIFFFVVNIGALEAFVERQPGIDYRAFQLPVAIVFAVTGISRANMLVIDIQTGYLDRMLVAYTTYRSALRAHDCRHCPCACFGYRRSRLGLCCRGGLRDRCPRAYGFPSAFDGLEPCFYRLSVHGCFADWKSGSSELCFSDFFPVCLPDSKHVAKRLNERLAKDGFGLESGYLFAGRYAFSYIGGVGFVDDSESSSRDSRLGNGYIHYGVSFAVKACRYWLVLLPPTVNPLLQLRRLIANRGVISMSW